MTGGEGSGGGGDGGSGAGVVGGARVGGAEPAVRGISIMSGVVYVCVSNMLGISLNMHHVSLFECIDVCLCLITYVFV